jgi:hypothetical protein
MSGKYDKYIFKPPHLRLSMKADKSVVFDGLFVTHTLLGCDFKMGHQFVRKPFKGDNPCHTHNFQEFLAWYGSNPDDPNDFQAEVVLFFGPELEKHVFTRPTIISLPPGLPHGPLEVTRVDSPIIQIEIMLSGEGGTRVPYFEQDKGFDPKKVMNFDTL